MESRFGHVHTRNSSLSLPIRITDVSPRDGLQNEAGVILTADKARLIEHLLTCGLDEIEVSSFVSAKWVPQLGDAAEVFAAINPAHAALGTHAPVLSALVPNEKGMTAALEVNQRARRQLLGKVSVFTAASETFCKKNTNASIAESILRFEPVVKAAHHHGLQVRGYISCIFACPFEGPITPDAVLDVANRLVAIGVDELDLGDTIGVGTPTTTAKLLEVLATRHALESPTLPITLHLHDTFGTAAACILTALAHGIRSFDGSAAGLGGCPYASTPTTRAPGNINTDLLIRTIQTAGFQTRVDLTALAIAAAYATQIVAFARTAKP